MGSFAISEKEILVLVVCLFAGLGGYAVYHHAEHRTARSIPVIQPSQTPVASRQPAQRPVVDPAQRLTAKLEAVWQQTVASSSSDGDVDIALYDNVTGATARYTNTAGTFNTASIIKLPILEALLLKDQKAGLSGLTADQLSEAESMIEQSDNDAATDLWSAIGGRDALDSLFAQIGATHTTGDGMTPWGLTQTIAPDQVKIVNQVAYPGNLLTAESAAQANALMGNVEASQRWGITAGVPAGVSVELKNGWLYYDNDITVNSIGHVHGDGVDYTIAVLTSGNKTMQDGIDAIQGLSATTWNMVSTDSKS